MEPFKNSIFNIYLFSVAEKLLNFSQFENVNFHVGVQLLQMNSERGWRKKGNVCPSQRKELSLKKTYCLCALKPPTIPHLEVIIQISIYTSKRLEMLELPQNILAGVLSIL